MHYTLLGSGTFIIRPERAAAAHLVELSDQTLLLMDCGRGAGLQTIKAGYSLSQLDAIVITHTHADHMGELISLLGSIYGVDQRELAKRTKPLTLLGYPGFSDDLQTLRQIFWPGLEEPYPLVIQELDPEQPTTLGKATICVAEVPHSPHFRALAIALKADGKKLVYSGDCGMNEGLTELAKDADLLICENGIGLNEYRENGPQPNHLSAFECGQIANAAKIKQLVLTHLYDVDEASAILSAVHESYDGPVTVGYDLLSLPV